MPYFANSAWIIKEAFQLQKWKNILTVFDTAEVIKLSVPDYKEKTYLISVGSGEYYYDITNKWKK